jgi:hypothetical protein
LSKEKKEWDRADLDWKVLFVISLLVEDVLGFVDGLQDPWLAVLVSLLCELTT